MTSIFLKMEDNFNFFQKEDNLNFLSSSRQPWKFIFGVQPYLNPTRRNMEDNHIFFQMEDDLHLFETGRQPQSHSYER
jgi:hypothetical protein